MLLQDSAIATGAGHRAVSLLNLQAVAAATGGVGGSHRAKSLMLIQPTAIGYHGHRAKSLMLIQPDVDYEMSGTFDKTESTSSRPLTGDKTEEDGSTFVW
jgi:hypothetical protein